MEAIFSGAVKNWADVGGKYQACVECPACCDCHK
jgi:hypothetical protein